MAQPLTPEEFSRELYAIRDAYHTKDHPFFLLWGEGKLTLKQMGVYMIQHLLHVEDIFQALGITYSRAPMEVRHFIIENLSEEHGIMALEEERDAVDHFESIRRFIYHVGFGPEDIVEDHAYWWTRARVRSFYDVALREPWPVFLAMLFTLESQEVGVNSRVVPAMIQHYGFRAGDPVIRFFEEHYLADQEHGRRTLELVTKYATDRPTQDRCLKVAEEGCQYKWAYVEEIYQRSRSEHPFAWTRPVKPTPSTP
ncbi:MAG: iron-containing redox enzyme family protein [Firmicutes bacterium]|nr:iron-containing redox enzyme family protein [Bacillota bacterium]